MIDNLLEETLKETWEKKEKFYEDTKYLTIMEIIEKVEGKKFRLKDNQENNIFKTITE